MSSRPHRSASTGAHRHVGPVHRGPQAIAPIHRGPQAVSHASTLSSQVHHAPNAALLIDFDNVTMGIRSELQTELKNLLSSDIVKGKVSVQRAYADWRRYPQYIVPLAESSIDMIMATAYGSAKKNATDIRLAVDAIELVFTRPEIGTFILLSGDSDFASLVTKLKEYGKYVIGVGIRESSSDLLVQNCDEYYSYNALAGLVKASEDEPARKYDPWELVTEALTRMKRNGDVMRSDRLKQVMQDIDPGFDEKNLGMSKFSRFVQEASQRGLVSMTKLENGQLEIGLPQATTITESRAV
ncbi:MAG: NYN domain-containing protein, partial [Gemmatimonadaceae bacterium]